MFCLQDYIQTLSVLVRGSVKEKLQWIFHFYDISDDGKLTKQVGGKILFVIIMTNVFFFHLKTFIKLVRSLYDLLGPNYCIHYPVTDETIEKHSALLFDVNIFIDLKNIFPFDFSQKLDFQHVGSVNLDDFEKYCLHVRIQSSRKTNGAFSSSPLG